MEPEYNLPTLKPNMYDNMYNNIIVDNVSYQCPKYSLFFFSGHLF